MSDPFEGQVHVVGYAGQIYCYGYKPDYHESLGAGGVRIRRGSRLACIVFGSPDEVPVEGGLREAVEADIEKNRDKGVET
jgi:hypothetical protein